MATKPSMSINLGLGPAPEVETPELYAALMPLYSAIKNVMYAVDSYTGNAQIDPSEYSQVNYISQLSAQKYSIVFAKLTEDMTAGTMVNFHPDSRLAARAALLPAKPAQGFSVASGIIGDVIPVALFGLCTYIGGLTSGTEYYMSDASPGLITATPTAQRVGFALGTANLWFSPSPA